MNDIVKRLREADRNSVQRTLGSGIFGEAADRICELESQMRGQTFLTPDEKDARIAKLEAALGKAVDTFEDIAQVARLLRHSGVAEAARIASVHCREVLATAETPLRQVHSKSEYKRLTALGVECVVTEAETKAKQCTCNNDDPFKCKCKETSEACYCVCHGI